MDKPKAVVLASGGVVAPALEAAISLAKRGVFAGVANVSSIKPLDEVYLSEALGRCQHFITVEDHYIAGGLGGVIAEFLATKGKGRLSRIGVEDFGQSGTPEDLYEHYGLNATKLEARLAKLVE